MRRIAARGLLLPQFAPRRLRFVPLAVGAIALLSGLAAGLVRIGVPLSEPAPTLAEYHSALMICGFLGTLISLERAVAYGRSWAYGAPAVSALGAVSLLAGQPQIAALCFLFASTIMTAATCVLLIRHFSLPTFLLCIAAAIWGIGTLLWLERHPMNDVAGWWLMFPVLTIVAERLELSRLVKPPPVSQIVLVTFVLSLILGTALGEYSRGPALFVAAGLIGSALWLLRYDVACRTIWQPGMAGFAAACMIAGHVWLMAAGVLLFAMPPATEVFSYDAVVHAIGIGFVMSMVFGHAPIILPAVTGIRIAFTRFAYLPLALLHLSLMLRIGADLSEQIELRAASGVLTVIALLGYAMTILIATRLARKRPLVR
jgi:hypothetical protein